MNIFYLACVELIRENKPLTDKNIKAYMKRINSYGMFQKN